MQQPPLETIKHHYHNYDITCTKVGRKHYEKWFWFYEKYLNLNYCIVYIYSNVAYHWLATTWLHLNSPEFHILKVWQKRLLSRSKLRL